uniref:Uncharacterized protein n=1 Tax=Panagrolaimus superbus TaxID=310955 RepID=A0A914Y217_9BILA
MGRVSKSRCNLRACAAKARLNRHKIADKFSVELSSIFLVEELNRYKEKEAAMNLEEQTESGLEEDTCEIMQLERRDKVVATVEETRRTPTKRKESSSTKREFNTLSRSGKKKRISKFKRSLSQNLPPSYRITKSPLKEPTVEESINLLISGNVTEKTYQKVRNLSTKPVVSRYSVRKEMLKLQKEYGEATEFKQNGIIIVGERVEIEFLAVGDLKFLPALMGLQGGSSDSFCPWCHITRNQVKIDGFRAGKRTSEDLILNAQQCESELKTNKKSKAASIRRKYGSVKGTPLIKFIQPEQLVPPPFHLLAQLVDSSIKYVTKNLNNTTLEDAIVQLNLNIHYPSQSLNGNESRKLLEKIRKREVVIEEPGLELFLAAADVEQFAVARIIQHNSWIQRFPNWK